jgi:hypothetical protein
MRSYVVKVYRCGNFYPDRTLRTHSRGRAERRIEQLTREGFQPKLLAVSGQR